MISAWRDTGSRVSVTDVVVVEYWLNLKRAEEEGAAGRRAAERGTLIACLTNRAVDMVA